MCWICISKTPLRIVNLVYNKTDIPLQLEEQNFRSMPFITSYCSRSRGIYVRYRFNLSSENRQYVFLEKMLFHKEYKRLEINQIRTTFQLTNKVTYANKNVT